MIEEPEKDFKSVRDIFAPVREQIKESGVSDDEMTSLLEEAREEVFQESEKS